MGTASQALADFVSTLRFEDLPPAVVASAKRHLLDAAGVALCAAAQGADAPAVDMIRSWSGAREASVIGHDVGAPAADAALANGTLAHSLDFDDTHVESVAHPSAVILATALAVGEEVGARGTDLIAAAVAGYEVMARVGAGAPGRFQARGLDTTGIAGPFGAAATAARLWGLGPEETAHALGIAGSRSSGLLADLADGVETKALHAGWAAHAGVIAADLARRGMPGPLSIFEGRHGFYGALLHGEEPDVSRVSRALGIEWETTRIALKPYPACHFMHAFMDAAIGTGVKWADIEEAICYAPPSIIAIVAEPRAVKLHPATTAHAQYSLPFAVASVIVGGRESLDLFGEEARADRRVLTLAERIRVEPDPSLPFPAAYGGRVRINTRGGRTLDADEPVNRGHPDRPLDDAAVTEKFLRNARARLDVRTARRALGLFQDLDGTDAEHVGRVLRAP
jgi:2-methylcitrate dehydratase PrpD